MSDDRVLLTFSVTLPDGSGHKPYTEAIAVSGRDFDLSPSEAIWRASDLFAGLYLAYRRGESTGPLTKLSCSATILDDA